MPDLQKYAFKDGGRVKELFAETPPAGAVPWPAGLPDGHTVLDIVGGVPVTGAIPSRSDAELDDDFVTLLDQNPLLKALAIRAEKIADPALNDTAAEAAAATALRVIYRGVRRR